MELNFNLMVGFLIWSAFCLGMLFASLLSSRKWKRAAKAMEAHANNLQTQITELRWERHLQRLRHDELLPSDTQDALGRGFERSIPKGVITHAKKQ